MAGESAPTTFGEALVRLMQRGAGTRGAKWTIEALASEIDVSPDTIGLWRNNNTLPRSANYTSMLRALGLDRDRGEDAAEISLLDDLLAKARKSGRPETAFLHVATKFPVTLDRPIAREDVNIFLKKAIFSDGMRLIVIRAPGGAGKSIAVRSWVDQREKDLRERFAKIFLWSFYRQGQTPEFVTIDPLFDTLAPFLGGALRSSDSARAKALVCLERLQREPVLLVIDGVEALQYPPGDELRREGRFKDDDAQDFFSQLAELEQGACIITSRIEIAFDRSKLHERVRQWELPRLTKAEGLALVRGMGLNGSDDELVRYVEGCQGHPLALSLACTFVRRAFKDRLPSLSEISLNAPSSLPGAKLAERILAGYLAWLPPAEAALLTVCGLFVQPVESELVYRLTNALLGERAFRFDLLQNLRWFRFHLATLRSTQLVYEDEDDLIDTHPLIKEYLGTLLERNHNEMWRTANRAMYALLAEYDAPDWQLRRIVFGCRGGLAQRAFAEVYQHAFSMSAGTLKRDSEVSYGAILYALNAFFCGGSASGIDPSLESEAKQVLLLDAISLVTALRGYADQQLPLLFSAARSLHGIDDIGAIRIAYAETRYHRMAGNLAASKKGFERLFQLATVRCNLSLEVGALRNACAYSFYIGSFEEARKLSECGEAKTYVGDWRVDPIGFVNNPVVMLSGYGALASIMLNELSRAASARERMRAAVAYSGDPHSAAIAAFIETILADFGLEPDKIATYAEKFERLAAAGELTQWLIAANILRAFVTGTPSVDFARLIRRWTETGARLFLPYWDALAAESSAKHGDLASAAEFAVHGLRIAHQTGEIWINPRLQRYLLS